MRARVHTYACHVNNLNYRLSRTEGLNIRATVVVDSFDRMKNIFRSEIRSNYEDSSTFDDTQLSRSGDNSFNRFRI